MSWIKPATAIDQPTDTTGLTEHDQKVFSFSFKGPYNDLKTAADAIARGDVISGNWIANSWNLSRLSGLWGKLDINCIPEDTTISQSVTEQQAKKETWSIRSIRNDLPILAYCDPAFTFSRYSLEMWQKETNKTLADAYKFKSDDGSVQELTSNGKKIAQKISNGVESVMRFYPLLTKRRLYSRPPQTVLEKLGYIDTPATGSGDSKKVYKPGNLAGIINDYDWVKCQDDCEEQPDGDWIRTESWMGLKKLQYAYTGETTWDPDLYGADGTRWPIPYDCTGTRPPVNNGGNS